MAKAKEKPAKPAQAKPAQANPAAKARAKPKAVKSAPSSADFLLAEILAVPDDKALRLVYADLLIEAGDPRGAFIAQQCALDALDALDERYAPMLAATHRLIAAHARTWIGDHRAEWSGGREPVDRFANARFTNGFLERIAMDVSRIAKDWPALRAKEPIQGLEVLIHESLPPDCRDLAAAAEFTVLKVNPTGWLTSHSFAAVLAWGMPRLRALDASGCDLGETGARMLANLPTDLASYGIDQYREPPPFAPGQLRELVLETCQIGDEGAQLLFAAEHLSELVALDLTRCRIADPATLEALRDAPAMRALRRFAIAGNNELGPHVGLLAAWPALPQLTALSLPQSTTPAAFHAMFPQPSTALRRLELASAKELVKSARLAEVATSLTHLALGTTSIGDDRWRELLAAPNLRRLVHLEANGCSLSDVAIEHLAASPLDRLVTLDVSSNKLTDVGLRALADWPGLQHVTHLRIGNNRKVTAAGLAALARSPHLQPAVLDLGKADAKDGKALRERFGEAVSIRT